MLAFHRVFRSKQNWSLITFPWSCNLISSRFLVQRLEHGKKNDLEQNKTLRSLPPLTSQITLLCYLHIVGMNNFSQKRKSCCSMTKNLRKIRIDCTGLGY